MTNMTLINQNKNKFIAGISPKTKPANKTVFQAFYNFLTYPGTSQVSNMKNEMEKALQRAGYPIEDCLMASYICLVVDAKTNAYFYYKMAQSGEEAQADLVHLKALIAYQEKQGTPSLDKDMSLETSRLSKIYQETEFFLFDTLRQYIHTPPYQPRFEPVEQHTFMKHGLKRLQNALSSIQERVAYMERGGMLPPLFYAKVALLKTLIQRYRKLERSMERFNKTAYQISHMLKHTQNVIRKQRFVSNTHYAQTLKMEIKDAFSLLGDQLELMEKLGYTIAPFLNHFIQLNEEVEQVFTPTKIQIA